MKLIRILPEMCASTRWPLGSSTRNIALGSTSAIVPSTSIASFLATGGRCGGLFLFLRMFQTFLLYNYTTPSGIAVSTNAPFSVTATVCSKWADGL
jgi:hypothetical protein